MIGAGRALPHNGLSALQPWKTNKAIGRVLSRKQALIRFMRDRIMRDRIMR